MVNSQEKYDQIKALLSKHGILESDIAAMGVGAKNTLLVYVKTSKVKSRIEKIDLSSIGMNIDVRVSGVIKPA